MRKNVLLFSALLFLSFYLSACGFHLQGELQLAQPLHRLYIQSPDPYGYLVRNLKQNLKMSKVDLVDAPTQADSILAILSDTTSQDLVSVSSTTQTRQYNLTVTVEFEITDAQGTTIVPPTSLSETRTITIQANQILGSSNETNLFYQQMRRVLASSMMDRMASKEVTDEVKAYFSKIKKHG